MTKEELQEIEKKGQELEESIRDFGLTCIGGHSGEKVSKSQRDVISNIIDDLRRTVEGIEDDLEGVWDMRTNN